MNEDRPSSTFSDQQQPGTSSPNNSEVSRSSKNSETTKSESPVDKNYLLYRSQIVSECGVKLNTTEAYLKRMQSLRNELNYLKETEWMYDSLDKKPPTL